MLEFVGDAISLSGSAGTKLKCDLLGAYYPFWWNITSGGPGKDFSYETVIVELHAGTGEVYIKDQGQTILGSAGHALQLKTSKAPHTRNLKIVLIEENSNCCSHLKNVIKRRWPYIPADRIEGPFVGDISKRVYLLNRNLDDALNIARNIKGNAIYFFDPLRSVEWSSIEKVARNRIRNFYQTGTEFIIFIFTSDWFLGRDDFAPLPMHDDERVWTEAEKDTVYHADSLFGNREWRSMILNNKDIAIRQRTFLRLYRNRLRTWFRYILILPFNPKADQLFHLIMCSNYEAGVRMNRDFYASITHNPKYQPDNKNTFTLFKQRHPGIFVGLSGNNRPLQWRVLWKVIAHHEDGICDCECSDLKSIDAELGKTQSALDWLHKMQYLETSSSSNIWNTPINQYKLNWKLLRETFGIQVPPALRPISAEQLGNLPR